MIMKKEEMKITELYDLTHTLASDYLKQFTYPWGALAGLSDFIIELGNSLDPAEYEKRGENIWVHKTAKVFDSAYLHGPVIVGKDAEVRHCAFIRGSALIGEGAVVGNSTELKNVILFDKVQVPHYNYVGDSILGYKSHMGAGSITSNVKSDKLLVEIHAEDGKIETGRKTGLFLFSNFSLLLIDRVCIYPAAHAGKRIDVGAASDDAARV